MRCIDLHADADREGVADTGGNIGQGGAGTGGGDELSRKRERVRQRALQWPAAAKNAMGVAPVARKE